MPAIVSPAVLNRLLESLPPTERRRVLAVGEPVSLVFGTILGEPGEPLRHAYFPLGGFISLVARVIGHEPLEIGLIGSEGVLGASIALGVMASPARSIVQGEGPALRLPATSLRSLLRECPALDRLLRRYLYVLMAQIAQTTACTRFHETDARLARWLLLIHDRAHADHFHLTHEFLAGMLGVRRSGLTIAAGEMQRAGLIRYTRGAITILDRAGLEAKSCECYALAVQDYSRILG